MNVEPLIARRWKLRLTAREVARRIGVHPSLVCKWEKGVRVPDRERLRSWRRALR